MFDLAEIAEIMKGISFTLMLIYGCIVLFVAYKEWK